MHGSFPVAAWILLLVVALWYWPDPSFFLRLIVVSLILFPAYVCVWTYFTGKRILTFLAYALLIWRLRLRHVLRIASLDIACFLRIEWLLISLHWQYLFAPVRYAQRIERLKQENGISLEEESEA